MSENVFQFSIRGRIPELDGKTAEEVLDIFREKFGEPEYEGEAYWDSDKHEIVPVYDYDRKRWGLQKVVVRSSESEYEEARISSEEIQSVAKTMQSLFPSIEAVFVSAYVFYDGTDEPIEL